MSKSISFDFKKIDVVEFLEELDIKNISVKGDNATFSCPFSGHVNGDRHPSANMRLSDTVFYCFSCGKSGNAISFLSDLEGVSPLKARQWLRERFNMSFIEPQEGFLSEITKKLTRIEKRNNKIITKEEVALIDEAEVKEREVDWNKVFEAWSAKDDSAYPLAYMFDRGFTPWTLDEWKIGWDSISQRIMIPVYDEYNNLIGMKGRNVTGEKPKYKVLGGAEYGFETYNVSKVLFGLPQVKKELKENGEWIIVVEGELNTVAMHQKGYINAVGISGKVISDYQKNLIKKYASRATFIFDEYDDTVDAAKELEEYMPVDVVPLHDKDPADMDVMELSALLSAKQSPLNSDIITLSTKRQKR